MTSPVVTSAPGAVAPATISATKRFALGVFEDEDVLLHAVDNVRAAGVKIYEVFSPYPVHGIDDALGIERSRLPIAAFFYGLCGLSFALWMQIYMLGFDWPMIIGGKPAIALPAFIPVSFELTVYSSPATVWLLPSILSQSFIHASRRRCWMYAQPMTSS